MKLYLHAHMNPPPDKKRKTNPPGHGVRRTEDENPWGDDYTEDELECMYSQAEIQPDASTCSTSYPPDSSQSTSRVTLQKSSTGTGSGRAGQLSGTPSTSRGGQNVSRSFPSRPFPEELQKCLQDREKQVSEYQAQLIQLGDDLLAREGEVALQRQTIEQKEAEILKYKQEKMGQLEADKRERSMKERQLQLEVDRLSSQVHFKEREVAEVVSKCKSLEVQIAQLEGTAASPVKLSTQTPKIHPVSRRSPRKSPSSGYPTIESFRGSDLPESGDKYDSCPSTESTGFDDEVKEFVPAASRKQKLATTISKGEVSGPHLVSRLLVDSGKLKLDSPHASGGILRLLLPRGRTPVNLSTVYLEREAGSFRFSPKHIKRSVSQQRSSRSQAYQETHGKSSSGAAVKNTSLATVGLTSMLSGDYTAEELSGFMSNFPEESEETVLTHGAVFLLPLVEDCVQEYERMLNAGDTDSLSSPRTSLGSLCIDNGSSSDRSSFHSLSSSLNSLLREGATYANNLEEITLAALNVLYELVSHCPEVVNWILSRGIKEKKSSTSRSNLTGVPQDFEQQEPVPGTSKDVPKLPASSPKSSPFPDSSGLSELNILYSVITLADRGIDNSLVHRQSVVELCLDIMYKLCAQCSVAQMESLSPVISLGVIHSCLGPDTPPSIVRRALHVLLQLVKCSAVLRTFCLASDGCVWMFVYGLCTSKTFTQSADRTSIYSSIIDCLSAVASSRNHGISKLLDSSCVCNSEVIKAMTALMGTLLEEYITASSQHTLDLIKRGVAFMHVLCQNDARLTDRQDDTVHNYVALVSRLLDLYKQLPGISDNDLSALHELWEFFQEDGSGDSQMDIG